jgi:hypothetical protein
MSARLSDLRRDPFAGEVTGAAIEWLHALFGDARKPGAAMAARAAAPLLDPHETAASCSILAGDLLQALEST